MSVEKKTFICGEVSYGQWQREILSNGQSGFMKILQFALRTRYTACLAIDEIKILILCDLFFPAQFFPL